MWRLRTIINTEVLINTGIIENNNFIYSIIGIDNTNTENGDSIAKNFRYLDIIHKENSTDIKKGFAVLFEELNCFMDKVAFLSYGKANVCEIISIC